MSVSNRVGQEAWEEPPIYAPYEDAISNRQRRALRGQSAHDRRTAARQAQLRSGSRIRIARVVINQQDFKPELKIWIPPVQAGVASRKSLGNLAMTLFDTAQQPLQSAEDETQEALKDRLARQYPQLFVKTPPIEVTGTALFGNSNPFIGLTFAPGHVYTERQTVVGLVAPELALDDRHQRDHRPHVSLGQVFSYERALEIQELLKPVLPIYVQFEPATVRVDTPGC